jgi:NAD(P)-dependent dehydrogenase (short-subunit alcohol dehydrogenase family)
MPTAVVTGAGRGLGRAIASTLAARGFTVHVTDVEEAAASEAASEIGRGAFGSGLDVRDEEACHSVAATTVQMAGSLDVWVNNAGILITGNSWEQDGAARRLMVEVNTLGTMNGTVAALQPMLASGRGHVINVVSLAGLVAAPGEVAYAASKHGAIAFTLGTMLDLRRAGVRGIHLSAVCPDGIWTPMLEDKLDDPAAAGSFSGVLQTPEQVAKQIGELIDRPRPVLTIPRWRGGVVRLLDAFPSLGIRGISWFMRDAERRQRRYRKLIESGRWPPA